MDNRIENSFPTFASGTAEIDIWREYFEGFSHEAWSKEEGGSLLFDTVKDRYELSIIYVAQGQFVLEHMCYDKNTIVSNWSFYAVEHIEQLNVFDEVADNYILPRGCLVRPETAWQVVEDFLQHPTTLSSRVFMINGDSIDWPESLE